MVSRLFVVALAALAALGDGISGADGADAVNIVEPENRYRIYLKRQLVKKRKSDQDDFESIDSPPSLPCTDTPGWTDLLGNTCEWYEQKDEPGCPAYSALWGVEQHCCYCKSNSTTATTNESTLMPSTSESEEGTTFPTRAPVIAPSGNPIEIQVPTQTPTILTSTERPSDVPISLTPTLSTSSLSPTTTAPTSGQPTTAQPVSEVPSDSLVTAAQTTGQPTTAQPVSEVPSDYPTLLTRTPTVHPSVAQSDSPTEQFLPGELLLSNKELGIELSSGLEAKLIASTGKKLELVDGKKSSLSFHSRMDGAGIIDLGDRGYVYVSNSEETAGGVYGL
eukprot:scaffold13515_cov83-Skeletonema_dohrnii-CCMP3373.AAC.2